MLRTRHRLGRAATVATTIVFATLAVGLASALPAAAKGNHDQTVTLKGGWAPFNRCPVDDPRMLAADGEKFAAFCTSIFSPGTLSIGGVTLLTTEVSNSQFGALVSFTDETKGLTNADVVEPEGGVTVGTPGQVAGGLQGLLCPSNRFVSKHLCADHHHRGVSGRLNEVTGELVNLGASATVNLFAGFLLETPIITLSYKLKLQNQLLGWHCYIGSEKEPITLQSQNFVTPASLNGISFEGDGTIVESGGPLISFEITGMTQGDNKLVIPAAHGCGPGGFFDGAINKKLSLPSPSGNNSMLLTKVTSYLGGINNPSEFLPSQGQALANYWHSAVVPPPSHKQGGHW